MKIVFKLKDGSVVTKTHDDSNILNEAMLSMLVKNFAPAKNTDRNVKNLSAKLNDISSVEIVF